MAISVSSIIGNIESALKAASGGDRQQQEPTPRIISPTAKNGNEDKMMRPDFSFAGKQIVGRMYVDGNGVPFRTINRFMKISIPIPRDDGNGFVYRSIRAMASSNYVGIKPEETKINQELINKIREYGNLYQNIDPETKKMVPFVKGEHCIFSNYKEITMFYFKPMIVLDHGVSVAPPSMSPASYVLAEKGSILSTIMKAIQSENSMNEQGWIDAALGRDGLNKMNIVLSAEFKGIGQGYEWLFNFKSGRGVELTQEDLDGSADLNNEFMSNIFDAERAEQDLKLISEQLELRKSSVMKNFDSVETPQVDTVPTGGFEPASKSESVKPDTDDDIPF